MTEYAQGGPVLGGGGFWLDGCTPRYISYPTPGEAMTAPELTEAEAAILARFEASPAAPESFDPIDLDRLSEALGQLAMRGGYGLGVLASERLAADLLPVVDRIANERAAAELRAAATEQPYAMCLDKRILNRRADALDPK